MQVPQLQLQLAWEIWRAGVVNLAVLACVLRATTKKRSSTFPRKKCTAKKILATPTCVCIVSIKS